MHMNAYAHIHICVRAPCAFPISVSRCWSLGHVQMLYSKAYAGESCSYWLTPQMGGEGPPPACPRHMQRCHVSPLTATSIHCQGNAHRIICICTGYMYKLLLPLRISQNQVIESRKPIRGHRLPFPPMYGLHVQHASITTCIC